MDTVDIPPPGIDFILNTGLSGTIIDINIEIVIDGGLDPFSLTGPYTNNLDITLTHLMTPVLIYDGGMVGPPTSRLDAIFDDEAAGASPKLGDVVGTFKPDEALSTFDGFDLNGDWKLTIFDSTRFFGEGDKLRSWRIFGEYEPFIRIPGPQTGGPGGPTPPRPGPIPEPTTMALLALGAGALYLRRRAA